MYSNARLMFILRVRNCFFPLSGVANSQYCIGRMGVMTVTGCAFLKRIKMSGGEKHLSMLYIARKQYFSIISLLPSLALLPIINFETVLGAIIQQQHEGCIHWVLRKVGRVFNHLQDLFLMPWYMKKTLCFSPQRKTNVCLVYVVGNIGE